MQKIFAPTPNRLKALEQAEEEYVKAEQLLESPQETVDVSFDGKDSFDTAGDVEKYPTNENLSSKTFGKCLNIF